MSLTIGELVGYLRIDDTDWTRKVVKAGDDLDRIGGDFARFGDTAVKAFAKVAMAMSALSGGTTTVAGVAAVVSSAAGALGILPAAGFAVGAGMAAAKIGMAGFSDTMANASDPEAFAESLKELSPAARETAIAMRELHGEWSAMQDNVQEQLFEGMAKHIRPLGEQYIPVLSKGLGDVAAGLNMGAQRTAYFMAEADQVSTVQTAFLNTRDVIDEMAAAMQPAASILLDLVAVGSDMLPNLVGGFGDAAKGAAEFVSAARESGQLQEWISQGLSTLGDLWKLLANIGSIVGSVFGALDASGGDFLSTLVALTGRVADFLKSFEAQQALQGVGEALATVGAVVGDVLMTALAQLAPIVVQLAPAFAQLATLAGGNLVMALQVLGPLVLQLSTFLSENVSWLGPLALGVIGAAKAFGIVTTAMRVLGALASVNPWVLLIAATVALVTLIVTHWDEIVGALKTAWDWIVSAAKATWDWIVDAVSSAVDFIWQLFLNWSLPGLIIKHWDTIVAGVETAVQWVLDAVSWLGRLPGMIGGWIGQAKDWAIRKFREMVDWIGGLPGRILSGLGRLGSLLLGAGEDLVQGLIDGIGNMAGAIWDKLTGIVGSAWDGVLNMLGINSPAREGIWAGEMIGQGLIDGLLSMAAGVGSASGRLAEAAMPSIDADGMAAGLDGGADPFGTPSAAGAFDGRALVKIENYHPPADAPPDEVAERLDWFSRGGG